MQDYKKGWRSGLFMLSIRKSHCRGKLHCCYGHLASWTRDIVFMCLKRNWDQEMDRLLIWPNLGEVSSGFSVFCVAVWQLNEKKKVKPEDPLCSLSCEMISQTRMYVVLGDKISCSSREQDFTLPLSPHPWGIPVPCSTLSNSPIAGWR